MKIRLAVALWAASVAHTADFHVTPDGRAGGNGSLSSPWDLVTALKHPAAVLPGDTIWVHGGVYRAPAGTLLTGGFRATLKGARNKPILVRAVPGERAILDGRDAAFVALMTINGEWTWYQGLEFTNSDPVRRATVRTSNGPGTRGAGLAIYGPNVKVINCVIHDTGTGAGFWQSAIDSELYGNIIFNNGWISPLRAHGHAIYPQNLDGVKTIQDNIIFNQFGGGIHIYGTDASYLRNFLVKGNTLFNDGSSASGGKGGVWNLLFSENMMYAATCSFMDHVNTGKSLRIENNYFGLMVPGLARVDRAEVTGNTFVRRKGSTLAMDIGIAPATKITDHLYDRNTYQATPKEARLMKVSDPVLKLSKTYTLDQLRQEGLEKNGSVIITEVMPEAKVFVRPNAYDPARAHVTIYNWQKQPAVPADVSKLGIKKGDRYELRNVQNYFAEKLTGIYNGTPIQVPMTGWSIARPIGLEEPIAPTTFPEFGVFLLTWKDSPSPAASSAASKQLPVAPGSLAEAFGTGLSADSSSASLPTETIAGTNLKIRDAGGRTHAAGLLSVSPEKISFQVPEAAAPGYAAVSIFRDSKLAAETGLSIHPVAPGLFTASGDGTGPALCTVTFTSPDSTATTQPCSRCEQGACRPLPIEFGANEVTLSLYGTGIRNADPGSIEVTVKDRRLTPDSLTPLIELAGLDLVNVRLPAELAGQGESAVTLTAGGIPANPVTIDLR